MSPTNFDSSLISSTLQTELYVGQRSLTGQQIKEFSRRVLGTSMFPGTAVEKRIRFSEVAMPARMQERLPFTVADISFDRRGAAGSRLCAGLEIT